MSEVVDRHSPSKTGVNALVARPETRRYRRNSPFAGKEGFNVLFVFGAPCQLRSLAGPQHGRTIPLVDMERLKSRALHYAFDLLHFDGFDTRAAPLIERVT